MSAARQGEPDRLRIVRTVGRSMEPLIRSGAQVGIVAVPAERIAVGDLVAFAVGGRTLVHRVIARRREGERLLLREKGDANPTSTWIGADQVLGRAAWVAARGGLRRLDAPGSRRTAAFIAAASRFEADFGERVRRLLPAGGAARLAGLVRAALLPLKAAGLPLLATAYPALRLEEGPELDFLLACFRSERAPAAPLDGALVLRGAAWHGIVPAVLRAASDRLPEQILEALRASRVRDALRRVQAIATLREVAAALGAAAIPYVVLKGAALAGLYPDGERPAADLDVLVGEPELERAAQVLRAAGYAARGGGVARRRFHFHAVLEPAEKGRLPVELHWDLVDRVNLHRVAAAEVLGRRRPLRADGVTFFVPAPEDALLYVALHAAKHGIFNRAGLRDGRPAAWFCRPLLGNRLLWFSDVERLLAACGDALDWGAVRERAERWNIGEELAATLGVARLLLPGSAADEAFSRLGLAAIAPAPARAGRPSRDSALRQRLLSAAMTMHRGLDFRPARLAGLARVLVPSPTRLRRYWRPASRAPLPVLYLRHPFHIVRSVLGVGRRVAAVEPPDPARPLPGC